MTNTTRFFGLISALLGYSLTHQTVFAAATSQRWACAEEGNGQWVCSGVAAEVSDLDEQLGIQTIAPTPDEDNDLRQYTLGQTRACPDTSQALSLPRSNPDAPVNASANRSEFAQDHVSILSGDVKIRQDLRLIESNVAYIDNREETIEIHGGLRFTEPGLELIGDSALVQLAVDQADIEQATYQFPERGAQGQAQQLQRDANNRLSLTQASYSTCEPQQELWQLQAKEITLDKDAGVGTAKHATLHLGSVPVLYTPYASFPLDDRRKSGFLVPSFGYSGQDGFDIATPYYFNLAPNYDATVTPRYLSDRGAQAGGEFRYLTEIHQGQINAEFLPDDDVFGDDRGLAKVEHQSNWRNGWRADVDLNYVTDEDYFRDLGTDLSVASNQHLLRRADLNYQAENWQLLTRLEGYQTIDDDIAVINRPYRRLPQLRLSGQLPQEDGWFSHDYYAELASFQHERAIQGERFDGEWQVAAPFERDYGFVTPSVALRYTAYQLDENGNAPLADDAPSRTLPTASLDSGLFFERDLNWFGDNYLQTLEPRVYYLYRPHEDQSDLPNFDTSALTFSYAQLFRDDRFVGGDRSGDANQATFGVTSRLLDSDGREKLRASVGQIVFFTDRRVSLGSNELSDSTSPLAGELVYHLTDFWRLRSDVEWDYENHQVEQGNIRLRYLESNDYLFNLGYRYLRRGTADPQEQLDTSFSWRLSPNWHAIGRNLLDANESTELEQLFGLEYQSCCWAVRAVYRRYLNDASLASSDREFENAFFIQLTLKGLAQFGSEPTSLLEESIGGYQDTFTRSR